MKVYIKVPCKHIMMGFFLHLSMYAFGSHLNELEYNKLKNTSKQLFFECQRLLGNGPAIAK